MPPKTTILCMDDDPDLLELYARHFQKAGYAVHRAQNGEQGLQLFRSHKPDLVLVDLRMPKIGGFQVLEALKQEAPETPTIVISGEGEKADVIQALRLGAWNYHAKPINNFSILMHSVKQALDKARLIKENTTYQKGLESKLGALVEHYPGFVFTCDRECRLTYMNQALKEYIGEQAMNTPCCQALFGEENTCPWCQEDPPVNGHLSRQEIFNPRDNRWYFSTLIPVFDNNGQVVERQIILADITERKKALLDLTEREEYLRKENVRLKSSLAYRYRFGEIIGKSPAMQEIYDTIINAAATDASVIIYGESGTGKELVAKAIHRASDRHQRELVYVNCGAIPENLIESEFFGYKKGAFSGATNDKVGYLDIADQGTLFLDEVGEIPLSMQIKLLRAIEGGGYTPIGGTSLRRPDVRIIAATNRDLKELVRNGEMRQDFLYRIHIIPIHLPPLRERQEDIPMLIDYFLKQYDPEKRPAMEPRISKALEEHDWPGNVRELQNTIHRFVTLKKLDFMGLNLSENDNNTGTDGLRIEIEDKPMSTILEEVEKKVLLTTFEKCNWHQGKTAEALAMAPKTLYRKMKQYSITKPSP